MRVTTCIRLPCRFINDYLIRFSKITFMIKRDLSEAEIMADILNRLVNSGMWGKGHQDVDQLKSWINSQLKRNGKRIDRAINRLYRERLIGKKNKGRSIYANPGKRDEIEQLLYTHL